MNLKEKLKLTEEHYRANRCRTGRWSAFDETSGRVHSVHGSSAEAEANRPSSRYVVRYEGAL